MLHDVLSKRIGLPLLDLQQRLRPSRRSAALAFAFGLRFRTEAQGWQDEKMREWVLQRLRSVLRDAAANTSYYSDLFRRIGFDPAADFGFDDFAALPPLERQDILTADGSMISKAVLKALLRPDASGGSSGEPVKIWVGPEEEGWSGSAREFFMRRIGVPPGSRLAYLWGHHLDPVQKMSFKQTFFSFINNERWFDCFRLSPEVLARYHQEMESYQPDCIVAYASALAAFAQFLRERNLTPRYPRKCIVTGAEKLFDAQREVAEEVFRKPIYERYGSRDIGMMGFQLEIPQSKDFIVDWPNLLVEPETSGPESPILVTKLHADGMPMIRYRIGDLASFPAGSRPGHPAFRLHSVVGRTAERIWLPNGSSIHGIQFPHLFKDFPVREFMVIQSADFSVEVKIIPGPAFSQESRSSILSTISKNLPGIPVTISLVESIPRTKANKWRPVLSHAVPRQRSED
jgi:phenylacetate-CoA ligase